MRKRFSTNEPFGLRLTIGVALSVIFLWLFLSVVEDLISNDPLVVADLRLVSLVQMFRNPHLNTVMLFLTYLGNWQIVAAGACLFGLYLALTRQWRGFLALFISILGGEFLVWLGKTGFARPRPDLVNALIPAQGLSFPSGHAFVAISFYGLVAWFVIERTKTNVAKAIIVVLATVLVLAIGLSRIYLGVHWPSDVLASFALGAAWLAVIITSFSVSQASKPEVPLHSPTWAGRLASLFIIVWIGVVVVFSYLHPLVVRHASVATAVDLTTSDFPSGLFAAAPRFSEDIVGRPMEPINVILVGSEADLTKAFLDAGWEPTDRISFGSSWRLLIAELRNEPPPRAPGLPTFWQGQPNRRGFQHVDPMGSARERHHLHVWDTAFRVAGNAVWVGTVHFDREAQTAGGTGLLIHQIDPAVDRERESLKSDLSRTKCAKRIDEAVVTEPMLGQNAVGSPFFTDGKAFVVFLKCHGAYVALQLMMRMPSL
ncbi:LssY C-terminal domain-containing protein [Phyllobacterium sp. LjRoot231]|uniref:LssY C-terminal domain-containing protein n=1 Tax=Phyllobacterium sp. LjRoot231 TaxID=3342289 RepID=UPI003ECF26FB